MHLALWVLAGTSFVGALVCLMRPRYAETTATLESPSESCPQEHAHERSLAAQRRRCIPANANACMYAYAELDVALPAPA